jgi:hypothetical protein
LSGILYLHDITQKRMLGSLLRNYEMFTKLCGNDAARCIVFVTTHWDHLEFRMEEGEQRENQLQEEFWKDSIDRGSTVARSAKNDQSASDIISALIERNHSLMYILIQHELVDLLKILPETQAGQSLRFMLEQQTATYRAEVKRLRHLAGPAQQPRLVRAEEQLRQVLAQVDALKIPLGRRIRKWLGL